MRTLLQSSGSATNPLIRGPRARLVLHLVPHPRCKPLPISRQGLESLLQFKLPPEGHQHCIRLFTNSFEVNYPYQICPQLLSGHLCWAASCTLCLHTYRGLFFFSLNLSDSLFMSSQFNFSKISNSLCCFLDCPLEWTGQASRFHNRLAGPFR